MSVVPTLNKILSVEESDNIRPWAVAGVLLFILLNVYRLRETLPLAGLQVEDVFFFGKNYGHTNSILSIWHKNGGQPYIIPITNFFAWLTGYVDVRIQPFVYQWTGFFWATLAVAVPFFSGMIRSRPVALVGPAVLGLIGFNHAFYSVTLIYTMYTGVAIAIGLLFFDNPTTRIGTAVFALALLLFPWFGPYAVLIIPTGGLLLFFSQQDRKKQFFFLLALGSTCLYYFLAVDQGTSSVQHLKQLWVRQMYLHVLLEQIIFLGLVDTLSLYFWFPILVILAGVLFVLRSDIQYLKYALALLALIAVSMLLLFASNRFPQYLYAAPCHQFISLFFWLVFLLFTVDRLLTTFAPPRVSIVGFMICCIVLVFADHIQHPDKWTVRPIERQKEFLEVVHYYETLHLENNNQFVYLRLKVDHKHPYFHPRAKVGSRKPGKQQLGVQHFSPPVVGREFIVVPEKTK